MNGRRAICVVGMHRSGTSLATRLLNLLGVWLGPAEHLVAPGRDNPAGFWEHRLLKQLDDELLRAFGGSWSAPPALAPGWELDPRLAALEARGRGILERDFGGAPLWGWKDPRACLTLAFWQRLVPDARYLVCWRRPHEVALSLERRDRLTLERGLHLWCRYAASALESTGGRERAFVSYDELMEGSDAGLNQLCAIAGRHDLVEDAEARRRLLGCVRPELRHHRSRAEAPAGVYGAALRLAGEAYDLLRDGSESALGLLHEATALLEPVVAAQRRAEEARWEDEVREAAGELSRLVPEPGKLVLVDQDEWAGAAGGAVPFVERDGCYWGPPADDESAVRELERLRSEGAEFIAFGWPAFWWLEHYGGLARHLSAHSELVLSNRRLVVYRLEERGAR